MQQFENNANLFVENWQKIVIITSPLIICWKSFVAASIKDRNYWVATCYTETKQIEV
jgi:hypothetical protein